MPGTATYEPPIPARKLRPLESQVLRRRSEEAALWLHRLWQTSPLRPEKWVLKDG